MSNRYRCGDRVPSEALCDRLDQLSDAVTKGRDAIQREFDMRVPAELDRDADLVLSEAAKRIRELEAARRWRPISEAPKDGRPIVVTDFERYAAVRWRVARDATREQWAIDEVNLECWYPSIDCFEPTHFRPLEPPHD